MAIGVGIDTGGTNTYAVVLDFISREVLGKGSALTTHYDYTVGIVKALDNALKDSNVDPSQVEVVSISTTLATNAIVEGKGCRVGLLMIGHKPREDRCIPTDIIRVVSGGHDEFGDEIEPLDEEEVKVAIQEMSDCVEGLAISSFFSVRNPSHEIRARNIAREIAGLPTVCGFEFTEQLGIYERTVTAVLNAKLIPLINTLLLELRNALGERGMEKTRLFVVKGSGSVISAEFAKERPVETILSGPAASVVGAWELTKNKDGIVIDIGGTTTDICFLEGNKPLIVDDGAAVGGLKTRVRAIDSTSIGVGGDSRIKVNEGMIEIGPERVAPIAFASLEIPELANLIKEKNGVYYFRALKKTRNLRQPIDEDLLRIVSSQPLISFEDLVKSGNIDCDRLNELILLGLVQPIGVTPTDVLHCNAIYMEGNVEAARVAVSTLAEKLNMGLSKFSEEVIKKFTQKIVDAVNQKFEERMTSDFIFDLPDILKTYFLRKYKAKNDDGEEARKKVLLNSSVIGLGAPAEAYIKYVGEAMKINILVPSSSATASALGAITSSIEESVFMLVQRDFHEDLEIERYIVHVPIIGKRIFENRFEAIDFAIEAGKALAMEKARRAGAERVHVTVQKKDVIAKIFGSSTYLRSEIIIKTTSPIISEIPSPSTSSRYVNVFKVARYKELMSSRTSYKKDQ